jgi:hypothetical protein
MMAGKSLIVIASSSLPSLKTQYGKQVKVAGGAQAMAPCCEPACNSDQVRGETGVQY